MVMQNMYMCLISNKQPIHRLVIIVSVNFSLKLTNWLQS